MKLKNLISHLLIVLTLTSCVSASVPALTQTPISTSTFTLIPPTATATYTPGLTATSKPENLTSLPESITEFIEPDPETYVMVLPAVLEYFYYRKAAMISGNAKDLWAQYPELEREIDISKGVNAEGFFISNYQGLKLFDGNIFPEEYERIKVKSKSDGMEVLAHGMELYLFLDENGQFNESGGEFKIVLYLRLKDGRWHVFKTDEVLQSEWQEFSP